MAKKDEAELHLTAQEKQLLKKVPPVKSVGNLTLRTGLVEIGWDEDTYWEVRNGLITRGILQKGGGRGGSVRRVADALSSTVAPDDALDAAVALRETKLYKPMKLVIEGAWAKNEGLGDKIAVEITAHQGRRPTGGTWTRPDIIVANYKTFTLMPGKYFDFITFEIKPYDSIDVKVIYEALAHRRAATRSYALVHVPKDKELEAQDVLKQVASEAKRHGVGLIVAGEPDNHDTWDELVEAVRHEPDPERMSSVLATQTSVEFQDKIKSWF